MTFERVIVIKDLSVGDFRENQTYEDNPESVLWAFEQAHIWREAWNGYNQWLHGRMLSS